MGVIVIQVFIIINKNSIMEKLLDYIKREKKLEKEVVDLMPSRIEDMGLRFFLIQHLHNTYYNTAVLSFLIRIEHAVNKVGKEFVSIYLDNAKKELERTLYKAKPHPYNTNELVNITSIWDFEMIPTFLKYIENMKRMVE